MGGDGRHSARQSITQSYPIELLFILFFANRQSSGGIFVLFSKGRLCAGVHLLCMNPPYFTAHWQNPQVRRTLIPTSNSV